MFKYLIFPSTLVHYIELYSACDCLKYIYNICIHQNNNQLPECELINFTNLGYEELVTHTN